MKDILQDGLRILMNGDNSVFDLFDNRLTDLVHLLGLYIDEIELFNDAYSLVNYTTRHELIVKHILDSLAALPAILQITKNIKTEQLRFADVGSGAGLPGIPLSIALNNTSWTLIERGRRRASFLSNVVASLGLNNVEVIEDDVKDFAKKTECLPYDVITFRAVTKLESSFVNTLFSLLQNGGCIAAYKGKSAKIEEELKPLEHTARIIPITVPFMGESRHLVVFT